MKSQHSEVILNYQLEHFGCMTWTKYIRNKSAFAETKLCLYGYSLKNAAAFFTEKAFSESHVPWVKVVLLSNLMWGFKSSSSWTAPNSPSSCFNTFASKPCKHHTPPAAHLCNFRLCSDLCRIYKTARPAEELFPDHGRWRKKKSQI